FGAAKQRVLDQSSSGCPVPADIWRLLQISFRTLRPGSDQIRKRSVCYLLARVRTRRGADNPFCRAHELSRPGKMALQHSSHARRNTLEIFEQGKLRLRIAASNPAGAMQPRRRRHVEQAKTFPVFSAKKQ